MRAIHYKIVTRAYIATAVAVAWITLALARCFRPERSWIERCGTALGVGWIITGLGSTAVGFLFP
jgi:hypothetical protein